MKDRPPLPCEPFCSEGRQQAVDYPLFEPCLCDAGGRCLNEEKAKKMRKAESEQFEL